MGEADVPRFRDGDVPVTYDMAEHRRAVRDHLIRLVRDGGVGWDDYASAESARYEKEDPKLHAGLRVAVKDAIAARDAERRLTTPRRK